MDVMGLMALVKQSDKALLKLLIPAGLCGTVIGTLLFGLLSAPVVAGVVGGITLGFLAIRLVFPPKASAPPPPRWLGFVLGSTAGFTSFVAHAGGPPVSFYLLPLRLDPIRFTATLAVLFTVINFSKWLPYAWLGLIDLRNLSTSLALAPFAPVGVWLGLKVVRNINMLWFYRLFHLGMLLTGTKLVWDALR
jgi:uncharacterized membrane protein YfcA